MATFTSDDIKFAHIKIGTLAAMLIINLTIYTFPGPGFGK